MRNCVVLVLAVAALVCGCGGSGTAAPRSTNPEDLVLRTSDMPRGYKYGDDSGCGVPTAGEGNWPKLEPLFDAERPTSCVMQLEWVWHGEPPYSSSVTSGAYAFRDEDGARRAFEARDELATYAASLTAKAGERFDLGDQAELVHGQGLNHPAVGVVWRERNVVAVLVVEPAQDGAVRELAHKQQQKLEQPSQASPQERENDPELQLEDPSVKLPVYWLGRAFDPPGALPPLELDLVSVGRDGPGQSIQLGYRTGVTLDTWEPAAWKRFKRTRLGRLIWDSPCAHKRVVDVDGGRAEIFQGYGLPNPVKRPCPKRPPDRVIAHVYYETVVVAVNMPYCYMCARPAPAGSPYNTVEAIETVVRSLRLR